jgi:putative glutamine amidotransferase
MTKPLIGVTAGEIHDRDHPWTPLAYGQSRTYTDSVIAAGGVPVILPITDDTSIMDEYYERMDGWLFAGGNDLDPQLYGQTKGVHVKDVSEIRDYLEVYLMKKALSDKKPVLGVCRGMQLLNVLRGGTLYQDIPTDLPGKQNHRRSSVERDTEQFAHFLKLDPASKFASIVGDEVLPTNTHHHQAVKTLGQDLVATAWAEDDIIEALEDKSMPFLLGVQSHPESMTRVEPRWLKLFRALVSASA